MLTREIKINNKTFPYEHTTVAGVAVYKFVHNNKTYEIQPHFAGEGRRRKLSHYTCRVAGNRSKVSSEYFHLEAIFDCIIDGSIKFN